jgi:hypothetical protein
MVEIEHIKWETLKEFPNLYDALKEIERLRNAGDKLAEAVKTSSYDDELEMWEDMRAPEKHQLEHSETVITNVHSKDECLGQFCTVHNMSEHILRAFPQHWREDKSIMERICDHGVGHPDPDNPWPKEDYRWIHGCCGCCGESADTDSLSDEPSDILQELRDFAYIIDESKGVAVVTMLESEIFSDAANEIERLRKEVESLNSALDDIADFVNDPQVDERIKDARDG